MWYVIQGRDRDDSLPARLEARPAHLARLEALRSGGRLLTAGPLPAIDAPEPGSAGFSGSLIIARFDSLREAEEWAGEDPYVAAGVYERVSVQPYVRALPE